jgi:phosphate acetyltransferase
LIIAEAYNQLKNNVIFIIMLQANEIDGMISGTIHTTAKTICLELQIIKSHIDVKLVSSKYILYSYQIKL